MDNSLKCLDTKSYTSIKAKYKILGCWKKSRSRMTQYELVLSSAQLFILKITQSLQPTSSKTTLILKEKNRTKQKQTPKPSWHLRAMSSDAVSDTAGHTTFSRSFPTLPHFPICERDQKFLPLVSSSDALRISGYLHRSLNATKARKRQNLIWRLPMPGLVLWWLPRLLNFVETAKSSSSSSISKAALTVCVHKCAGFRAWIRDRKEECTRLLSLEFSLQSVSLCWLMIKSALSSLRLR